MNEVYVVWVDNGVDNSTGYNIDEIYSIHETREKAADVVREMNEQVQRDAAAIKKFKREGNLEDAFSIETEWLHRIYFENLADVFFYDIEYTMDKKYM